MIYFIGICVRPLRDGAASVSEGNTGPSLSRQDNILKGGKNHDP